MVARNLLVVDVTLTDSIFSIELIVFVARPAYDFPILSAALVVLAASTDISSIIRPWKAKNLNWSHESGATLVLLLTIIIQIRKEFTSDLEVFIPQL